MWRGSCDLRYLRESATPDYEQVENFAAVCFVIGIGCLVVLVCAAWNAPL